MKERVLTELLQPLVEDLGLEFVGVEYHHHPKNAVVRLYVDTDEGVGLDDCERVSREVAALLDVEDPVKGHYTLEVSSPGLDRPLFTAAQFAERIGEVAAVTTLAPLDGRRRFKGPIVGVEGEVIELDQDGVTVQLELANMAKARLVPDYEALMRAGNE